MKSLKEYISQANDDFEIESEVLEAAPELDMKNAVVKKLAGVCAKNGYQLKKAFLLGGGQPVLQIMPSGAGWHPAITYSTLNRPALQVDLSLSGSVSDSKTLKNLYLSGLSGCMNVVKAIETLPLDKLPEAK